MSELNELVHKMKTKNIERIADVGIAVRESYKQMGYVKVNEKKITNLIWLMETIFIKAKL